MAFRFILLILPALALASIDVEISGIYSEDSINLKVKYNGTDISVISETESITFNVTENNLKNAIGASEGKRPDFVVVRDPTRWGDIYSENSWDQVSRTLVLRSGKILKTSSQPTIVSNQTFENQGTKPATYNVGISQSVANTVSSSWNMDGELTIGQKINYDIKINVSNGGGEISFSYVSSWGQNTQQLQTVTVGASSNKYITLQPGEAIVSRLEAIKGFVQVETEYEASLSGQIAFRYNRRFFGPYQNYFARVIGPEFFPLPIDSCMSIAGLNNKKTSREVIDIGFFSDSKVIVSDLRSGKILMVL